MATVLGPTKKLSSFKIVLLGEASVGKSALVLRFTRNTFPDTIETTIGAAFTPHRLQLDSLTTIQFEIWDTAGQERFASLAPMYYRGAAAALVVFDQSSSSSYDRALVWIRQLRQNASPSTLIALLANKADLSRKIVDLNVAAAYAESNGLLFFETSAKTGFNINLVFTTIGRQLMERKTNALNSASSSPTSRARSTGQSGESTAGGFKLDTASSEAQPSWFGRCCGSS